MEKILKYIDENYADTITKDDIGEIMNCSQRNTQRLFKRFFGETVNSFQKRLKLENAYKKLVYSKETIKNIAYDVGYENQSTFSKAFLKHFQITPTEARNNKQLLFKQFIKQTEAYKKKIDSEVVYIPPKPVFYKLIMTDNYSNKVINDLWDNLDEKNDENINFYGLILDQPLISGKTKCRYEACVDVPQNSQDFLTKKIFGAKYLKCTHFGAFNSIEDTYRQMFYNWVYQFNYEIDNGPIIEHYIEDHGNEDGYRTEIYVPLKLSF